MEVDVVVDGGGREGGTAVLIAITRAVSARKARMLQ